MAKITFYRQARIDGGVRTGLAIGDEIAFDNYEAGSVHDDPTLRWFVDVRVEGRAPTEPEAAREWLLDQAALIKAGLREFAHHLKAGVDSEAWPALYDVRGAPKGARIRLACSASSLLGARQIATVLSAVAAHFETYLKQLRAAEPVGRW
jgi:hypothetical protein